MQTQFAKSINFLGKPSSAATTSAFLGFLKTLTTAAEHGSGKATRVGGGGSGGGGGRGIPNNDDYFAVIHHISNIVRRDIYLERTLNKMRLSAAVVNSELVYRVLRNCCNCGSESFRFFNWVRTQHPSYDPTTAEFDELLRTLARTRHWETMWKVAQEMKTTHKLPLSPDLVSFIIQQYGNHGLIDQALELFNKTAKAFDCPQTSQIYNSLLFALCQVKNFQGAYALIRRMIRKGVKPDKSTYSILVNGWCSAGKMREAQQFLEEMSRKGFNPPVRGRDLLIDGLLNAGYLEAAKELVRKMTKEGFVPDIETFNSLAEALLKSGEVDFCIDLYHSVCGLGLCPKTDTYKIMITAASKVGRVDEAFGILHRSMEAGQKPFPSLYAPILKALCRKGQFDDAFCFFSDMKVKGGSPNRPIYTMLITWCGRGGRFLEAANYLMEMTEFNLSPMSRTFDMVTDGLKNCGKHDLAKKIEQLEISLRGV
ncbi:pentatricopeptide repeat-containing protein At5g18390, mitochondrial-like isoform X1 [Rhododendron vialii]|uniref:pentatricopeptide repeat-containing protein At5g18390, mitochondrial-like isoform X1 n=1 Tax=Rhododendron vialii TaxID=182163 RepID=UPI00265E0F9B|nr:pentatricopeptide repeat-containing protein At5g18390, mitochondrial-like isoform X1 [Rhododendron vialii]